MAPLPQASASPTPTTAEQQSGLPGLKRGIAIGVASSVCLILIALLAHFAVKRRRKLALAKAQNESTTTDHQAPSPGSEHQRIYEKALPPLYDDAACTPAPAPAPPVEAEARPIYEMDAGQVPELPSKAHVRDAQELDGGLGTSERGLKEERRPVVPQAARQVPVLRISPPEISPLGSVSPLAVSPLGISPLEEAYSAQTPREPHRWI